MERVSQTSPKLMARMVGVFYILLFASGFDLFHVFGRIVIRDDAAATAANILVHRPTFLAGFACAALGVVFYLAVTALFYLLFEPVNRTLSLCGAFFSLTGCIIQGGALILHLVPLIVLGDQPWLAALPPDQRQAMALVSLMGYLQAYNLSLIFFACYLVLIGVLVFRSTFLPRWLGPLVALGVGWLAFLYPPLARALYPYVMLSSVGEILLVLWLLVKGVDEQRWYEQAAAAGY